MYIVMTEESRLLTPREVAEQEQVHVHTVYRWIADGLKVERPGVHGHIRIRQKDLDAYLHRIRIEHQQ